MTANLNAVNRQKLSSTAGKTGTNTKKPAPSPLRPRAVFEAMLTLAGWHPVGDSNPCCRRERAVLVGIWEQISRLSGIFWGVLVAVGSHKPWPNVTRFMPLPALFDPVLGHRPARAVLSAWMFNGVYFYWNQDWFFHINSEAKKDTHLL